jgi:hypothetical protein
VSSLLSPKKQNMHHEPTKHACPSLFLVNLMQLSASYFRLMAASKMHYLIFRKSQQRKVTIWARNGDSSGISKRWKTTAPLHQNVSLRVSDLWLLLRAPFASRSSLHNQRKASCLIEKGTWQAPHAVRVARGNDAL